MRTKEITEFDKVYIAKYVDNIGKWQISRDLNINQSKLENIIEELKKNGLYDIYHNLSEEEWEKIERMKRQDVLKKYLPKAENTGQKVKKELIELFFVNIRETIMKFPIYDSKDEFNFNYFKDEDYENEEWKKIEKLNYEISNYGRIKNLKTKKLKALRNGRFGYQINLWNRGKARMFTISRLVAHFFIRPVIDNERVIHLDGQKKNNYYKNLKIVSK